MMAPSSHGGELGWVAAVTQSPNVGEGTTYLRSKTNHFTAKCQDLGHRGRPELVQLLDVCNITFDFARLKHYYSLGANLRSI